MESHFVSCDECRESLTLFARVSSDQAAFEPVRSEEINQQTAGVIALIKQDEVNRIQNARPIRQGRFARQWQLAGTAVLVLTITIALAVWFSRPSATTEAMSYIALAMKEERQLEPRLSGGIEWSPYPRMRGPEKSPNEEAQLQLERAQSKLNFAKDSSAPTEARLTLARAYLASGTQTGANNALTILRELAASGYLTTEVLNDTGVALFQIGNYEDAASYFSKALENRSDFNEALFNRALAEYKAAHYDESRRDWTEFIRKSSDPGWKQDAQDYLRQLDTSR